MINFPIPDDELERLKALRNSNLLFTPMNKVFEHVISLTKEIYDVPIVAISLLDRRKQWIISSIGLNISETPREDSFCTHTILNNEILIVENTLDDKRFANNPYVANAPHIRFYAGIPIHGENNHRIGALCIIDRTPRHLSADEVLVLQDMAAQIDLEIKNHYFNPNNCRLASDLEDKNRQELIDQLTRLWNKKGIIKLLNLQIQLSNVKKTTFGLMMLDIDNFNAINEKYTLEKGDDVLKNIAKLLLNSCRSTDAIGRWEQDKFIMIISAEERANIFLIARRIQKQLREKKIKISNNDNDNEDEIITPATISLVFFNENKRPEIEALINELMKAIKTGKNSGKNQLIVI